jgi:type VI secretion system protein ImpL
LKNPLYDLPWYIVMGERASGKTTAIKSARLSSPFDELNHIPGISGTGNGDWWFFDQGIILDTAEWHAATLDEGRDNDEWQKFLSLLIKFRKKEPVSGLIVTVPADKLIEPMMEILDGDGRNIRRSIDELMEVFGTKFPVYLMVTKCDLIQGMTHFCNNLTEKNLDQAMGFLNQEMSMDIMALHERAVRTVSDRLRELRLLIIQHSGAKIDPELLLFPEEFERIKPGLDTFINAAFEENLYQETPVLRGIFYTSGCQEGSPYSHFMNSPGLIQEKEILPGTNRGLFLHDFFSKILPETEDCLLRRKGH